MKISEMQERKKTVQANLELLNEEVNKLGITEVPQAVQQLISEVYTRISVIRFVALNDYATKPAITAELDDFSIALGELNIETGLIPCFVFNDELAKRSKEMKRISLNVNNIKRFLESSRRKLPFTAHMETFIREILPAKQLPNTLIADGSDARVRELTKKPGAKLYASEATTMKLLVPDAEYKPGMLDESDVFAVEYIYKDTPMLTIFVRSHDYKSEQAKRLEFKLQIPDKLAEKICENLPHDMYYAVADLHTDFKDFVARMASLSRKKSGDSIHDYVSNEDLDIVFWDEIQKNVIDADDESPCAVLIGPTINVFVPNKEA